MPIKTVVYCLQRAVNMLAEPTRTQWVNTADRCGHTSEKVQKIKGKNIKVVTQLVPPTQGAK